jgi:hypothetical protein
MRVGILAVFLVLILASQGCTQEQSDRFWKAFWIEAANQTIQDANPLKAKCEAGFRCENGELFQDFCSSDGKGYSSGVSDPYTCSGTSVDSLSCTGSELQHLVSGSVMHCGSDGRLDLVTCSSGKVYVTSWNDYKMCNGDDLEYVSCSGGKVKETVEVCTNGTSCSGDGDNAGCR